jgi:hypothetical protein
MNIFVLDKCPYRAAEQQCDKHVVKMVLETGQMLSTVHRQYGNLHDTLYRETHSKHPCTQWAGRNRANYNWLFDHFCGLANEYLHRYGKTHKSFTQLYAVVRYPPDAMPDGELTPFALAMPEHYKGDDAVESYRRYYLGEKSDFLTYTKRQAPYWLSA